VGHARSKIDLAGVLSFAQPYSPSFDSNAGKPW